MNSSSPFPNNGQFISLLVLNALILLVTLPINIYVLWLICTRVRTGVAPEYFVLNLSVCEIIICMSVIPSVVNFVMYRCYSEGPFYYFLNFLSTLHVILRPFFQCCICVERYVAVVYPVIFLKFKPLRYRMTLSAVVWILVLVLCALCTLISFSNLFYFIILPQYLLYFSIMIFFSVALLKALKKPGPGNTLSAKESEANHVKKKAFWVILTILVFMFITYGPIVVFICLLDTLSDTQKWDGMTMFSYFVMIAGFIQPFLYLHRAGKLKFKCSST